MSPLDIVRLINAGGARLKEGGRWQASHKINGKQTPNRPQVQRFDCGLNGQEGIWFLFELTEDDGAHSLRGTFAVDNRNESIKYDSKDVEDDNVIVSHRFRGFELRGVLEFEFLHGTETHRYRFDATLMKGI